MAELVLLFKNGKTLGSLIIVPDHLVKRMDNIEKTVKERLINGFRKVMSRI